MEPTLRDAGFGDYVTRTITNERIWFGSPNDEDAYSVHFVRDVHEQEAVYAESGHLTVEHRHISEYCQLVDGVAVWTECFVGDRVPPLVKVTATDMIAKGNNPKIIKVVDTKIPIPSRKLSWRERLKGWTR